MKNKGLLIVLLLAMPVLSIAKSNHATEFVEQVKRAADGDGSIHGSIDINCPASSASGKLVISKVSYEINKSEGAFVFNDSNETSAPITMVAPEFLNDDFTSDDITGFGFTFKMPSGQFFVDIYKDNKAKVGVNKNGSSNIHWMDCNIVKPS